MTDSVKVSVNTKELENVAVLIEKAALVGLRRVSERGEQLLRKEVPTATTNLQHGVSSDVIESELKALLVVSARRARRGARTATLHQKSGATKEVKLSPQEAFDYAQTVAEGRKEIKPKRKKVLLIPVASPPTGEAYVAAGNEFFVMRARAKAVAPNPYDQRAFMQLEKEAVPIFQTVLDKVAR